MSMKEIRKNISDRARKLEQQYFRKSQDPRVETIFQDISTFETGNDNWQYIVFVAPGYIRGLNPVACEGTWGLVTENHFETLTDEFGECVWYRVRKALDFTNAYDLTISLISKGINIGGSWDHYHHAQIKIVRQSDSAILLSWTNLTGPYDNYGVCSTYTRTLTEAEDEQVWIYLRTVFRYQYGGSGPFWRASQGTLDDIQITWKQLIGEVD